MNLNSVSTLTDKVSDKKHVPYLADKQENFQ